MTMLPIGRGLFARFKFPKVGWVLRVMLPQEHVLLLLWDLVNRKWQTVQIIARVTVLGVTKHKMKDGRDLCHFLQSWTKLLKALTSCMYIDVFLAFRGSVSVLCPIRPVANSHRIRDFSGVRSTSLFRWLVFMLLTVYFINFFTSYGNKTSC